MRSDRLAAGREYGSLRRVVGERRGGSSFRFRTLLASWERGREAIIVLRGMLVRIWCRGSNLVKVGGVKIVSLLVQKLRVGKDAPLYDTSCLACSYAARMSVCFRFRPRSHPVEMASEHSLLVRLFVGSQQ